MAQIVFYTNPQSRGRIVRWMLEELEQPYEPRVLGFGPPMRTEAFLAINPMGKVPVIVHGDKVVTECAAICAYLADAFPEAGLAPAPQERADYYRYLFFAAGPIEAALSVKNLNVEVPPEKRGQLGYGTPERAFGALERMFEGRTYVTGERFSAADVYLGAQLMWAFMFDLMPKTPALEAYVGRVTSREAYQRSMALDNAAAAELERAS